MIRIKMPNDNNLKYNNVLGCESIKKWVLKNIRICERKQKVGRVIHRFKADNMI